MASDEKEDYEMSKHINLLPVTVEYHFMENNRL